MNTNLKFFCYGSQKSPQFKKHQKLDENFLH